MPVFKIVLLNIERNLNLIMCLCLISRSQADKVIAKLGFTNSFRVEVVGFAGGIWLLWNDDVIIEPLEVHSQFIHIRVMINGNQHPFLCTKIYGS